MTALLSLLAVLGAGLPGSSSPPPPPGAASDACPAATVATAPVAPTLGSIMAPAAPRDLTRVALVMRPFLGLIGNSWGQIGELRVEHYFRRPFAVGVELSPLAVASAGQGAGVITHARATAAYVTDHLAVGLGVGARLQRFGGRGVSIAPSLRLGSLDGLSLSVTYTQTVARNFFTGEPTVGFSNLLSTLVVPVGRSVALELAGGLSLDAWAFGTLGLRHRVVGDGGPGTWIVGAAFGVALIVDRAPCDFDAATVCGSSARSFGPTMAFSVDHRF